MEDNTSELEYIKNRIDAIRFEKLALARKGNDLWEEKEILRKRYKELTEKEI